MDKKLNSDLLGFFNKSPNIWDKILIEDTHREKGEIGSSTMPHKINPINF